MENKTNNTSFIENIKDNLVVIIVFSVAALIMIIGLWFPFVSFILSLLNLQIFYRITADISSDF